MTMDKRQGELPLAEVARRLDGAGMLWAVFAGAAAMVYGATHALTDIDILVPVGERDRVLALFPEAQVQDLEGRHVKIVLAGYDLVPGLDLVDLDAPMAARLERHRLLGVAVPVVPPEDNIVLKSMWGRGAAEGKHDWEDVEAMIAGQPALDWDYLRWRVSTFPPSERRQQALARLEMLWEQR